MKLANLLADGQLNNTIFDLNSPNNLDNWHYPYWLLRSLFESYGVELNTSDVNDTENIIFELHQDVRKQINNNVPCYVMLYETPHIRPINKDKYLLAKYKRIFTWRYDWVDGQRYIKFNAPNRIVVNNSRGWAGRDKLCCLIAGNKSVPQITTLELYSERVKTIKWFEMHAPEDFDLFGHGWNKPAAHPGLLGKLDRKLRCILPKQSGKIYFPSYRGKATSKLETLQKYRFNLCYENVKDLKGYITEKIFDSFFSGCIPVYWGASNINEYVPESCFIDRRKFTSHEDLYNFMVSMPESEFIAYQERIAEFLASDQAKPFSAETFAENIVNTIVSDLGISA